MRFAFYRLDRDRRRSQKSRQAAPGVVVPPQTCHVKLGQLLNWMWMCPQKSISRLFIFFVQFKVQLPRIGLLDDTYCTGWASRE